jgi:hypothetical protein
VNGVTIAVKAPLYVGFMKFRKPEELY